MKKLILIISFSLMSISAFTETMSVTVIEKAVLAQDIAEICNSDTYKQLIVPGGTFFEKFKDISFADGKGCDLRDYLRGLFLFESRLNGVSSVVSELRSNDKFFKENTISIFRPHEVLDMSKVQLLYESVELASYKMRDMKGIDLSGADLSGVNLSGAYLWGANLSNANLSNANLSEASLWKAKLNKANLSGADLSGASLRESHLIDTNLSDVDLILAKLYRANLSGADLSGANLSYIRLYNANLSGADLSEIITPVLLYNDLSWCGAIYDSKTNFPGIDSWFVKGRCLYKVD